MSIPIEAVPSMWAALRSRWTDRDERMDAMTLVLKGDWTAVDPNGDQIENRSANMIQVGIEDTAESASLIPTVRISPSKPSPEARKKADAMEKMALSYLDRSQHELLTIESNLDLVSRGFYAWIVKKDEESGAPIIERRDPRTVYPSMAWRPGDLVRSAIVAREVYLADLPRDLFGTLQTKLLQTHGQDFTSAQRNRKIILAEVYSEDETLWCALYSATSAPTSGSTASTFMPIEISRTPNPGGICPLVIAQRLNAADDEPRGQFDQVIPIMQAHIRLMALSLDYSDQAVYSDIWVKDLIGQMPYGGGSYIQLGAQGSIGRVPPAVSSLSVQQDMAALKEMIHLAGRWPSSRPGEIDQAIASAKFLEATAGMMNTVIRTMHLLNKRAREQALRVCFKVDAESGDEYAMSGVLRNQQFNEKRDVNDIDLDARVRVEYGMGLGRDPAQSLVMGIQAFQAGIVSLDFVQENFDGITDVGRERQRIERQTFTDMAKSVLLQQLQGGGLPPSTIVNIVKGVDNGEDIIDLFDKFVAQPQAAAPAPLQSGLGGPPPTPGPEQAGPGQPSAQAPPPPGGAGLVSSMSRLSANLPSREGFMSTGTGG